jgi:hypothetical protein
VPPLARAGIHSPCTGAVRRKRGERQREQAGAETLEELTKLGRERGYNSPEDGPAMYLRHGR